MQLNFDQIKKDLHEKGYAVVKGILDKKEINYLNTVLETMHKKNNYARSITGLHRHKEYWDIISNEKIKNLVSKIYDKEFFYLYNSQSHWQNDVPAVEWHRDNPCRRFGIGPDWDKKEEYNVLRFAVYLSPIEHKTGLNVIPYSHKKKYQISSLLRVIHLKLKKYKSIIKLRNLFHKITGKNIYTDQGDCILFFANLIHGALPTLKDRKNIIFSFGIKNKHSENYMNYFYAHRGSEGFAFKDSEQNIKNEFSKYIKDKGLYCPMPDKKIDIEGAC